MAQKLEQDLNIIQRSSIEVQIDPITADLNIIQALDDEPNDVGGLSAQQLKAKFDEAGNIIKTYINESLIPQVLGADATEAQREANEEQRQANEAVRQTNEETREAHEAARVSAEAARNVWEDYNPQKNYVPGNKVYYLGSSYVNTAACTDVLPTVEANWQMVAKKGADGEGSMSQEEADQRYLKLSGGTMTGHLHVPEFSTNSFSMGRKGGTTIGSFSVAGFNGTASGYASHAEGNSCTASGNSSHAEGSNCTASGSYAHAEGFSTAASMDFSHAEGWSTIANGKFQHVGGKFNVSSSLDTDKFIIGKGGGDDYRANCFRVTNTSVYASGSYNASGADYAELFEWADGNPDAVDRVGRFVTLDGAKIRLAGPTDDYILGIVSGNPSVVGDVHDDQWQGMYLTDIFGRPIWEDVEVPVETAEEPDPENPENTITHVIANAYTERRQKLNPDYDTSQLPYIPRSQRPEWDAVGMLGKLVAVDDGTCQVNGWAAVGEGGAATFSAERTRYRVMERLDESHVRVLILI